MSRGSVAACVVLLSISTASAALAAPPAPAGGRAKTARRATTKPPAKVARAAPAPAPVLAPVVAPAPPPPIAPEPVALPAPVARVDGVDGRTPDEDSSVVRDVGVQRRFAITLNPLPMAIGRFGGNVEVLAAPHHALTGSLFVQTYPTGILGLAVPSVKLQGGPSPLVGGEIGYRYYTSRATPSGFFVGPSFVAMPIAYPRVNENLDAELLAFHAYGAAIDFGAQLVTSGGFTFGGGLGVMALAYTPPASAAAPAGVDVPTFPEPHVLPRLLVSAGWAF